MKTALQTLSLPVAALWLAACATVNPYATATTPEQYAAASYLAAAVVVHEATAMANDATLDPAFRSQIAKATLTLEQPLAELHDVAVSVEETKAQLGNGTTAEQVQAALALLAAKESAVAAPLATLSTLVAGGK